LILRDQKLLISHSLLEVKLSSDHDRIVDKNPIDPSSMELHASHILDLDVSNGIFSKEVRSLFQSSVHPFIGSAHFTMAVSFGRASFRLDEDMVSLALEAAIGAHSGDIKVSLICDRVFPFTVAFKAIGFHILKLRSYECFQFKCYFHIWGYGGPNWQHELCEWQKECKEQWKYVGPTRKHRQPCDVAKRTVHVINHLFVARKP
jgi:hypothetical protein